MEEITNKERCEVVMNHAAKSNNHSFDLSTDDKVITLTVKPQLRLLIKKDYSHLIKGNKAIESKLLELIDKKETKILELYRTIAIDLLCS